MMQPARFAGRAASGWKCDTVEEACRAAAAEVAENLQPFAKQVIEEHRAAGRTLVLATTSPEPFVRPIMEALDFDDVVCTRWKSHLGSFTGELDGEFLWGRAKADGVVAWAEANGVDLADSYAYSDSYFDTPLLDVGRPSGCRQPRSPARRHRRRQGLADSPPRQVRGRGQDRRTRASGLVTAIHSAGDRRPVRPYRDRRHREHPSRRPRAPGVQPSLLFRSDGDGPHLGQGRAGHPGPRQEGSLRRADHRSPGQGHGRHSCRAGLRIGRAARASSRRVARRRGRDDGSAGHHPPRTGILRSRAEGTLGGRSPGGDDRRSRDSDRPVGHRERVAPQRPAAQADPHRPPARDRHDRRGGSPSTATTPMSTPPRS